MRRLSEKELCLHRVKCMLFQFSKQATARFHKNAVTRILKNRTLHTKISIMINIDTEDYNSDGSLNVYS